jgi:chromosomal replication initiation ATPase DnaA
MVSFDEPRKLTIYFIRQLRGEKFKEICRDFGLKKDSSVGSILNGIRTQMVNDGQFRNRVERLRMKLIKS